MTSKSQPTLENTMFVGHYAAGLALKSVDKNVSLGTLFLAVQFVDILFFPLALLGIEKFRLVENFTQSTHFELLHIPYTHSLMATFIWGLVAWLIFRRPKMKNSNRTAIVIALAVMSHWAFDFIVHTPDLPLLVTEDSMKVGMGLWNNAIATYSLEALLLVGGLAIYLKSMVELSTIRKIGMVLFVGALLAINVVNIFGAAPADGSETTLAITSITLYLILALIAYLLDRGHKRVRN